MEKNEIISLKEKRFRIESLEMSIRYENKENTSILGVGHILQNENGDFEFYLYNTSIKNQIETLREKLENMNNKINGTMVNKSEYATLEFTDINGKKWKSEWCHPISSNNTEQGTIYSGLVRELSHVKNINSEKNSIYIKYLEKIEIPTNATTKIIKENKLIGKEIETNKDLWHFEQDGFEFYFQNDEIGLNVILNSNKEINEDTVKKLERSLQFVLGIQFQWNILKMNSNGKYTEKIRGEIIIDTEKGLRPPLRNFNSDIVNFNKLFFNYFNYDKILKISELSLFILISSKAEIEVQTLTITTAIESILNNTLIEEYNKNDCISEENVEEIIKVVKSKMNLNDKLEKRIKGSLTSLNRRRPKDIFEILINNEVITKSHFKSWDDLRNAYAHGVYQRYNFEKTYNYFNNTYQLYYLIIFHLIGYTGSYTDYSESGWIEKDLKTIKID